MKILLRILTITSFISSCFAFNVDTRKTFSLHLRNGGDKLEDNQEPAYAGYNFDVTLNDDDTVSILVGQPRSGEPNRTVSPGSLYYCNFKYLGEMNEADIVTKSPTTESATTTSTSMTTSVDNDTSMETTTTSKSLVTTAIPEFSTPNCTKLEIFDWTNPNHRDLDHKNEADALGLSLARIKNSTYYVACTPLRQRICPSSVSYTPGACYVGNPKENYWTFKKWEEIRCLKIEIIFVVDGSFSIGVTNFKNVRDWLVNCTVELFDVFGETVRTEVLQYSNKDRSRDRVLIKDSTKFEIPYTLNEVLAIDTIKGRIKHMKYLNSQTYTYYALRRAMEVEFPRSDFYETSKKIIVVLTDGAANDKAFIPQWYEHYKDTVTTFAVGVGSSVNIDDLSTIANGGKNLERVFKVANFTVLEQVITKITSEIKSTAFTESSTIDVVTTEQDTGSIQLGMSITSSKNGGLYLGAVGSYEESGIVMKYDDIDDIIPDIPSYSQIQDALPDPTPDSYMGYATVIGYFDGMTSDYYVATGAPRHMLFGAVVVYKPVRNKSTLNNRVTIMLSPSKRQVAEYYGGSLLALDVSGDGKDDLFVGAPLNIGDKYDEGRVLVYISQDSNTIQTWANSSYSPIELYGRLTAGRFGTAIANAGDINRDGFNDVVIGAPLADDSRGAVYIYHGIKDGIKTTFGQEIRASEFTDATPKYFGHFLQGNIDIDKNKYPDIFVGAPRTDSVVILRSRPIVKIYVKMDSDIYLVNCTRKEYMKCNSINFCFLANGTSVESEINMRYNWTLDTAKKNPDKKRIQFFPIESTEREFKITVGKMQCFNVSIYTKETDFKTKVAAELEFDLLDSHIAKPFSSVRDPSETNKKSIEIYIEKNCPLPICMSDLRLDVQLSLPPFTITKDNSTIDCTDNGTVLVIDSSTSSVPATVKVNMSNNGETAFKTAINVTYTSLLGLSNLHRRSGYPASSCIVEDGTTINIGNGSKTQIFLYNYEQNVMIHNSWCYFEFNLITAGLEKLGTLGLITVNITAYTSSSLSEEVDSSDNNRYKSIKIKYRSDYSLKKVSSNVEFAFNHTSNGIKYLGKNSTAHIKSNGKNITSAQEFGNLIPDIRMDFQITGEGFSNIPTSDIVLTWPAMSTAGNPLLYLLTMKCYPKGSSTKNDTTCTCDDSKVNLLNLTVDGAAENETSVTTTVSRTNVSLGVTEIDCTADNTQKNSVCETQKCTITNLGASDQIYFEALFLLWTPSIYIEYENPPVRLKSGFKVSTTRSIFIINKDCSNSTTTTKEVITTAKRLRYIEPSKDPGDSAYYLLIVFPCCGGCCGILWKQGYFTSKYAKKMKEAKPKEDIEPDEQDAADDQN